MSFIKSIFSKLKKEKAVKETQKKTEDENRSKTDQPHSPHRKKPHNKRRPQKNRSHNNDRDNQSEDNDRRPRHQKSHHNKPRQHDKKQEVKPEKAYVGKPFSELNLHPDLIKKLNELEFTNATKVQEKSIPKNIEGKNIFCSSETGSGKTLAFLLPMIHKFYENKINQALIICPTREIAIQIEKTLKQLTKETLSSCLVIGGTNMEAQKQALKAYPQILVATPGRLLDMLTTGMIWLAHTEYVVLDEADRMLDMGFEPDLIAIHEELSGSHQTVLFSATLFPQIKKMANRYAKDYEEIVIGNPTRVANSVTHVLVQLKPEEKEEALRYIMSRSRGKMMVFFNTIRETIAYERKFSRNRNARVDCLHSKMDQSMRQRTIDDFRSGKTNVLLASDVASRGIDIPNVDLVVNFDIPNNSEEYIHRVGRTGRAGNTGKAISFYAYKDKKKLADVEKLIQGKIERRRHYREAM